ncbi:DUF120 domain-containing protein [Methanopyrus sp. SNP6]|uniref:DUF120 domain-containing protein n=1 Tax=Methanopyrus sp. SNP6 TaxID=1937005 RepID=UPI0011E5984C|nr:DUF120 domain-containing protein [Methanopyrus sp. SNP6]
MSTGPTVVVGEYVKGLGEGRRYVSIPYYRREIERVIGTRPFPGTFNVRVEREERESLRELASSYGYRIEPHGEYGGAWLYPCLVGGRPAWLVFPDLTEHRDQVEFISETELRREINVTHGDTVKIEVWGPSIWELVRKLTCNPSGGR